MYFYCVFASFIQIVIMRSIHIVVLSQWCMVFYMNIPKCICPFYSWLTFGLFPSPFLFPNSFFQKAFLVFYSWYVCGKLTQFFLSFLFSSFLKIRFSIYKRRKWNHFRGSQLGWSDFLGFHKFKNNGIHWDFVIVSTGNYNKTTRVNGNVTFIWGSENYK